MKVVIVVKGVKTITRRVYKEPRTTCGELKKNMELAGTTFSKKIIGNALICRSPYITTEQCMRQVSLYRRHVEAVTTDKVLNKILASAFSTFSSTFLIITHNLWTSMV